MSRLFFNKSLKKYYIYPTELEPLKCHECGKVFENEDSLIYERRWNRKQAERLLWCERCFKKGTPAVVDEYLIAYITGIVPTNSILIQEYRPEPQPSKLSCFEFADLEDKEVQVNNKCKVAFLADRNMMPALESPTRPNLSKLTPEIMLSLILDAEPIQETKLLLKSTTTTKAKE